MITLSRESEYAYGLSFQTVREVREHVSVLAPARDLQRYVSDTPQAYVARILDLPVSCITVSPSHSPKESA